MNISSPELTVRHEHAADIDAIFELTRVAFLTARHTSHTEQFIVNALRRRGQLALSMVAADGEQLVGHVAFSPVAISSGEAGWYGVGPISVLPDFQRRGIGSMLMRRAMTILQGRGAKGCVLVGDPAYYSRFGFLSHPELTLPGVPPEYFQALSFGGPVPKGTVTFDKAFEATE